MEEETLDGAETAPLALSAALNAAWAMEPEALTRLLDIAARQNEVTPEALERYRAKTLAGADRAQVRDKVAIINATGPMFKRANLMTAISGATSYDVMRRDLQAALDAGVKGIALNIDSPGGEVAGAEELAQAIYDARDKVPIIAYVSGAGASAAYWLASAAHKIVVEPTAILGSIGVQWATVDTTAAQEKKGVKTFKFVSSQSPMKNADPGTEDGANHIQAAVDAQAQVFVETVARNRGVAIETVLNDFGKGGIFVGQQAIDAGLADSIGSFETVLAELSAGGKGRKPVPKKGSKATMDEITFTAAERDQAVTAAVTAERERIAGLRSIATAMLTPEAELNAAIEAGTTVAAFSLAEAPKAAERRKAATDAAVAVAAEAAAAEIETNEDAGKRLAALKTDEEAAEGARASTGEETDTVDAVAARIAAA
jgi:signal peptide peptidase SppA